MKYLPSLFLLLINVAYSDAESEITKLIHNVAIYSKEKSAKKLAETISFPLEFKTTQVHGLENDFKIFKSKKEFIKTMSGYFYSVSQYSYSNNIISIQPKEKDYLVTQNIIERFKYGPYAIETEFHQSVLVKKINGSYYTKSIHNIFTKYDYANKKP
jgi:hypothetical protein